MKKLTGLLIIAAFILFPLCSNAGIIGNVNLTNYYSSPTGSVTWPSNSGGSYYLDYDAKVGSNPVDEAFCVENATADSYGSSNTYTLLTIDSGLSAFGLDATRYLAAAWIAEYYYVNKKPADTTESWKAGAQIAVWEVIFDGTGFNLGSGSGTFRTGAYASYANAIWAIDPGTFPTSSSHWALAVNPVLNKDSESGGIAVSPYQNYLVHYTPTPVPPTLLLLGSGLVGLVVVRRRKIRP